MKFKRFMCVLMAATMLAGTVAGCGDSDSKTPASGTTTGSNEAAGTETKETEQAETPAADGEESYIASEEPLTLSVHMGTVESGVFSSDWPIFQKAAEMTNVTLEGTLPDTVKDFSETLNLVIASGDIPDIMQALSKDFYEYGPEGAFLPLNNLIDENAPHLKKFFEENPDIRSACSDMEGTIWFIPFIADGLPEKGWFIRQDWLDKLNLEQPKTVDELHTVLTAFVNDDPNGNGQKDEVGFFHRNTSKGIEGLLGLWNAYIDFRAFDGKVVYGPMEPEYGVAMENLAQWYKEGLIDKEIFTRGAKSRDILLADNVGGLTHDFFASTGNYNDQLAGQIEGFAFNPILPPADVDGVVKEPTVRARAKNYGWGIGYSNPDPVATIKYFDFWFTEEGRRMANFGIEGDTYEMVNGKPIFTDKVLHGESAPVDVIRTTGAQSNFGFWQDYFYEEQWTIPLCVDAIKEYEANDVFVERFPVLKFTKEEQDKVAQLMPKIETYVEETKQQWILGAKPVDFESYQAELKKLGGEELVEIYQTAYDRYQEEMGK